jgi:hypothetical protein
MDNRVWSSAECESWNNDPRSVASGITDPYTILNQLKKVSGEGSGLISDTNARGMNYDYIIDSNAKFEAWQSMTSGCEKVLIKKGTWTHGGSGGYINLSITGTKVIVGEYGSTLVFSDSRSDGALYYANISDATGYMQGVTIQITGAGTNKCGFENCSNLDRCYCTANISGAYTTTAFRGCTNLTNGTSNAINTGSSLNYGFYNCTHLRKCVTLNTGANTGFKAGFSLCNFLTDCTGNVTNTSSNSSNITAFEACNSLENCSAFATMITNGTGIVNGFLNSTKLSNCTSNATSVTGNAYGFNNCGSLSACSGTGQSTTTPGIGIGFSDCIGLQGCIGTGTGKAVSGVTGLGFASCSRLSGCVGTGSCTLVSGAGEGNGFKSCTQVVACSGIGTSSSGGAGYGFSGCKSMQQNGPNGASKTATYDNSCFADSGSSYPVATGEAATNGYNKQ